ncbi:hypothetical protein LTR96_000250 [Exophiala xenobiotica]|nr:hypothetical protein LTR96_000250 [Exophiala xenobiotica]KAK5323230.1 hypothetical protein LTR93_005283 [Exophiala xenobiotica]KAK5338131.1 hypothetical protein LTR98_005980 [Exophiala xenobiotica]
MVGPNEKTRSNWRCQACLDANEECELGRTSNKPYAANLSNLSNGAARNHHQQLPAGRRSSQASGSFQQQSQSIEVDPHSHSFGLQDQVGSPREPSCSYEPGGDEPKEGSEMLLVRLADTEELEENQMITNGPDRIPNKVPNRVVYFGSDSIWLWAIRKARRNIPQQAISPRSISTQSPASNVHYEIPDTVDRQPYDVPADDFDWKQEEMNLLQKKGAFSLPPLHVQKALLDAYFRWVFPMQQLLDREQFLRDFEAGRASVLLLQALFFVGTTCCDDDIIREHWGTRRSAQVTLYRRVKALYDADYEQNQITVIQVLFSMTSWWGSPTDEKDFSHWLAAAVRLAQVNGMHRSTKHSHLSAKYRKLWKRIWWTLYVRDHFDAASLGRPMLIHDDDCDLELLDISDFMDESEDVREDHDTSSLLGAWHSVEMAKLAVLLGRIIRATQQDKNTHVFRKDMDAELSAWEKRLPERLRYDEHETDPRAKLFAAMLSLGFHWCKILLHRQIFLDTVPEHELSVAPVSANAVTRVVEDLLAEGVLHHASVYLIAILFACVTIHIIRLRQSEGSRRRVLQHKAQLCALGLAEFKDSWPFVGWMYRLFRNVLERLRVEDSPYEHHDPNFEQRPSIRRPPESDLSSLPANGTAAAESESTAIPMSFGGLDARSTGYQPAAAPPAHTTSGMASFDNFMDPFMSLDPTDWLNLHGETFGSLRAEDMTLPFPMNLLFDQNSSGS